MVNVEKCVEVAETLLGLNMNNNINQMKRLNPDAPEFDIFLGCYKSNRQEAIQCGFDTSKYDAQVKELIKNHPRYNLD